MRFRLRTLLIAVAAVGVVCGVVRWWWITPHVLHVGKVLNGTLTEDWLFKRKFPNGAVQIGIIRYYSNGKKAMENRWGDGGPDVAPYPHYPRYWLDDGTEVSHEKFNRRIESLMREKGSVTVPSLVP